MKISQSPHKILYDIDMDFFTDSDRAISECTNPKTIQQECLSLLHGFNKDICFLHVEHVEALYAWDAEALKGWICWHFDAHHDMGEPNDSPLCLPLGMRQDYVNSGNYLAAALREGIISELHWIYPSWMTPEYANECVAHLDYALQSRVILHNWNDVKDSLPLPSRVDISFSPYFTPVQAVRELADYLSGDVDSYMDAILNAQSRMRSGIPKTTPYAGDVICAAGAFYYHGSANPYIDVLQGAPLYLSPSPAVACCFGLPLNSDEGWVHGVDYLYDNMPTVYISVPKDKQEVLNQPVTLYLVNAEPDCLPGGYLDGYEYISNRPHSVVWKKEYANAWQAFEEYGVYVSIQEEINLPPEIVNAVREYASETEQYFEMPVDIILSLGVLKTSLLYFLISKMGVSADHFGVNASVFLYKIIDRVLLPKFAPFMLNATDRYHGQAHTRDVARFACLVADMEKLPVYPALIAACLHDAARSPQDKSSDDKHAEDGADLATIILPDAHKDIIDAIRYHSQPTKTDNPVGAVLQDADRLRLAWEHGARPGLFSTTTGARLAQEGAENAYNFLDFHERLYEINHDFEVKFELTDACNMQCSFCHQGFGHNSKAVTMPMDIYKHWLMAIKQDGVGTIRLTGGEPLLVKDLPQRLELAKEMGFRTTLNTNAVLWEKARLTDVFPLLDCIKISFPGHSEAVMKECTGLDDAWERKLELAAFASACNVNTEFLTPMFPDTIAHFEAFTELFEQLPFVKWLPLRAEATPQTDRPVNRQDMLQLINKIKMARNTERWEDLQLYLSVPFCLLDSPADALALFHGHQGCGPLSSVVISPNGQVLRCYSRRDALKTHGSITSLAMEEALSDYLHLPQTCRLCPVVYACLGGCRCPQTLTHGFDYLARPEQAEQWKNAK